MQVSKKSAAMTNSDDAAGWGSFVSTANTEFLLSSNVPLTWEKKQNTIVIPGSRIQDVGNISKRSTGDTD